MKVQLFLIVLALAVATNSESEDSKPAAILTSLSKDKTFDGSLSCLQKCPLLSWCRQCRFRNGDQKCTLIIAKDESGESKKYNRGLTLPITRRPKNKVASVCRGPSCNSSSTGNLTVFQEYKSWAEARKTCRSTNSRLVVVQTPEKQKILEKLARSHKLNFAWIGARDFNKTDIFEWLDGSPMNYTAWATGEPSHVSVFDFGDKSQDCVELNKLKHYKWNDRNCKKENTFICENI